MEHFFNKSFLYGLTAGVLLTLVLLVVTFYVLLKFLPSETDCDTCLERTTVMAAEDRNNRWNYLESPIIFSNFANRSTLGACSEQNKEFEI